jgi:hypothetical protein
MYDLDAHAQDEVRYEERPGRLATGLCSRPWCNDEALPDGEFCPNCEGDVQNMVEEAERSGTFHTADDVHLDLSDSGRPLGLA